MSDRSYSSLILLPTFHERFEYLRVDGIVGEETFGSSRFLNQYFYNTNEWKKLRNDIIIRDNGCDMALPDCPIRGLIHIHHLNPISKEDILSRSDVLLDPENLVCVSEKTHKALHYGTEPKQSFAERSPNDTCPWKKIT